MFALDRYPTPLTHRALPVRRGKYGSMMWWALSAALPATHQQPHNPHMRGPMVAVPRPMGEVRWRFDSSTWVGASAPCRQPPLVEKGAPSPSAHPPSPYRARTDRLAPSVLLQIAANIVGGRRGPTPRGVGASALVYELSSTFDGALSPPLNHTPTLSSHPQSAHTDCRVHCMLSRPPPPPPPPPPSPPLPPPPLHRRHSPPRPRPRPPPLCRSRRCCSRHHRHTTAITTAITTATDAGVAAATTAAAAR